VAELIAPINQEMTNILTVAKQPHALPVEGENGVLPAQRNRVPHLMSGRSQTILNNEACHHRLSSLRTADEMNMMLVSLTTQARD